FSEGQPFLAERAFPSDSPSQRPFTARGCRRSTFPQGFTMQSIPYPSETIAPASTREDSASKRGAPVGQELPPRARGRPSRAWRSAARGLSPPLSARQTPCRQNVTGRACYTPWSGLRHYRDQKATCGRQDNHLAEPWSRTPHPQICPFLQKRRAPFRGTVWRHPRSRTG
ncbi:hypothetical protein SAMN02745704_02851, partial [Paucidesulfovibrio gracilis DSM 16080]